MATADNKRIAKNTLFLYLRMLFIMAISLYTSRVVLEKLGVADFGLYNVIGGIVVMLSFVGGALAVTTQRFLTYEMGRGDFERLRLTFSQSLYVHLAIGLIAVILAETAGLWFIRNKMVIEPDKMPVALWIYQFSIITFVISLVQVPYRALITAHEQMSIYAVIGVAEALLALLTAIIIGFIPADRLFWYGLIRLFAAAVVAALYCGYCIKKYTESRLIYKYDGEIFKSLTNFAGWSVFGSLAWTAKNQGINIILNMFFSTVVNAAYGIANQVNAALNSFVQNFTVAINPQIVKSYAAADYDRVNMLMIWGGKVSFMLLFMLVFPVINALDGILAFWLTEVPDFTADFIKLILAVSLLESFTFAMGTALQATGKIKAYQMIVGLTILANLPLSWLFLKAGFPPTSALAISVGIAVVALMERMTLLKSCIIGFSIRQYSVKVYLRAAIITAVSIVLYEIIATTVMPSSAHWLIKACVSFIIAAVSEYAFGFSSDERAKINHGISTQLIKLWKK